MRENIYYWKCDSPLDPERKKVYNSKYELADISRDVEKVCSDIFGEHPTAVKSSGAEGNHYGYIVSYPNEEYFFRADDGLVEDDYMLVESKVMSLVSKRGVPVPKVFHTDVSRAKVPFRFQILELLREEDLNKHHQKGVLDIDAIAPRLGAILADLHSISKPGFGFVNSGRLSETGEIEGMNKSCKSYFETKLNDHLAYIVDHELISANLAKDVESAISANSDILDIRKGSLTHRDMALWNVIGSRDSIKAVIDWDDVVIGHPADDFGILTCFYDEPFLAKVAEGYGPVAKTEEFERARWLHALRNMLWKMMIRHYMGYFEQSGNFFILNDDNRGSLYDFTLEKIKTALKHLNSRRP